MGLGSIPTDYVVLVSAALTALIVYQSRRNGLETEYERERHLNNRMQSGSLFSPRFTITVDGVHVYENTGLLYQLRKWILNSMSGECTVLLQYERHAIPGSFWETPVGEQILESYWADIEHLETMEYTNPVIARFHIKSIDYSDVAGFPKWITELDREMPGSIQGGTVNGDGEDEE